LYPLIREPIPDQALAVIGATYPKTLPLNPRQPIAVADQFKTSIFLLAFFQYFRAFSTGKTGGKNNVS